MPKQTASQTIGPYFADGLTPEASGRASIAGSMMVSEQTAGSRLRIEGRLFDANP